jgi:predicted DNA repair protein MutK
MAITLAAVSVGGFWMQAAVLVLVGFAITAGIVVALIVKADDAGMALARSTSTSAWGPLVRGIGRLLVKGMPGFLTALGVLGTAAMIWVGPDRNQGFPARYTSPSSDEFDQGTCLLWVAETTSARTRVNIC